MRKFLAHYFYYTNRERAGILAFFIIVAVPNLISVFVPFFKTKVPIVSFSETELTAMHFQPATISADNNEPIPAYELFPFNPNDVSYNDLLRLGLPMRTSTTFVHYREKGGHFYKKEDVKKIYGLSLDTYERLEPYIRIEEARRNNNVTAFNSSDLSETQSVQKIKLENFDPNTASEYTLLNLGLEKNIVKNLLKYREKGGFFRKKEDMKKLYSFSEIDFLRLEPYIQITDNQTNLKNTMPFAVQSEKYFNKKNAPSVIDLNTASEDDLLRLYGIGHTFAARITEYRTRLGGFTTISQLKEVFGIEDSIIHIASPYLILSPIFRKIQINKAGTDGLKHPYLTYKQGDVIVRYRLNHGNFKNFDDLKKTGVFKDEQIEKLKSYIDFTD